MSSGSLLNLSILILFGFPLASHAEDTTKENTSFRETSNKRIDIDVDKGFANYGTFRLGALVGIRMHWASFFAIQNTVEWNLPHSVLIVFVSYSRVHFLGSHSILSHEMPSAATFQLRLSFA